MYSFAFPIYDVSEVKIGELQSTRWTLDCFRNWKWRCHWRVSQEESHPASLSNDTSFSSEENEAKWFSGYLQVSGYDANDAETRFGYQCFVQHPNETTRIKFIDATFDTCSAMGNGLGRHKFVPWEEFEELISKDTDSVLLGATIYFV